MKMNYFKYIVVCLIGFGCAEPTVGDDVVAVGGSASVATVVDNTTTTTETTVSETTSTTSSVDQRICTIRNQYGDLVRQDYCSIIGEDSVVEVEIDTTTETTTTTSTTSTITDTVTSTTTATETTSTTTTTTDVIRYSTFYYCASTRAGWTSCVSEQHCLYIVENYRSHSLTSEVTSNSCYDPQGRNCTRIVTNYYCGITSDFFVN